MTGGKQFSLIVKFGNNSDCIRNEYYFTGYTQLPDGVICDG